MHRTYSKTKRIPCEEEQGESRVRENRTHGLVDAVNPTIRSSLRIRVFTLIELLVVIAVITILAGLLLPALQNAKAFAKRTQCASNVKELVAVFHFYVSDYQEYMPSAQVDYVTWYPHWYGLFDQQMRNSTIFLSSYTYAKMPQVWWCPAYKINTNLTVSYNHLPYAYNFYLNGFAINNSGSLVGRPRKLQCVKRPSQVFCISDSDEDGWRGMVMNGINQFIGLRHGLNTPMGFVDGHIAAVNPLYYTGAGGIYGTMNYETGAESRNTNCPLNIANQIEELRYAWGGNNIDASNNYDYLTK